MKFVMGMVASSPLAPSPMGWKVTSLLRFALACLRISGGTTILRSGTTMGLPAQTAISPISARRALASALDMAQTKIGTRPALGNAAA